MIKKYLPNPQYGEKIYINSEHYYKIEKKTGAIRHSEVIDWEWDGNIWQSYFIYDGIRFEKWKDVFSRYEEIRR